MYRSFLDSYLLVEKPFQFWKIFEVVTMVKLKRVLWTRARPKHTD